MADINCEENGDCFLVASKKKSDLIALADSEAIPEHHKPIPQPVTRKMSRVKKKGSKKDIKGRVRQKRVSPKKVTKLKGRKPVAKSKSKKPKKKDRKIIKRR